MRAGVAVKPKTDLEAVLPLVSEIDMVHIMTVEPGFGGQAFMADQLPKVQKLRDVAPQLDIQVDGGLNEETVIEAAKAGANVIVAGSAVFKADSPKEMIAKLREPLQ